MTPRRRAAARLASAAALLLLTARSGARQQRRCRPGGPPPFPSSSSSSATPPPPAFFRRPSILAGSAPEPLGGGGRGGGGGGVGGGSGGRAPGRGEGGGRERGGGPSGPSSRGSSGRARGGGGAADDDDDEDGGGAARVRRHHHHHRRHSGHSGRKSNAVGDPDGDSSDDESDGESELDLDDLGESELEELLEAARARVRREAERRGELELGMEAAGLVMGTDAGADVGAEVLPAAEAGGVEVEVDILERADGVGADGGSSGPESVDAVTATRGGGGGGGRRTPRLRLRPGRGGSGSERSDGGGGGGGDATSGRAAARQSLRDEEDREELVLERRRREAFDDALVEAFLPLVFPPPPRGALERMRESAQSIDVAGRRRLDRRTLYQGLLLELTHPSSSSHPSASSPPPSADGGDAAAKRAASERSRPRRRYLDPSASRSLRSALSLASQPKWRRHVALGSRTAAGGGGTAEGEDSDDAGGGGGGGGGGAEPWSYASAIRLYATDEEEAAAAAESSASRPDSSSGPPVNMGGMWGSPMGEGAEGEENDPSAETAEARRRAAGHPPTMGMQETVATALAHSLGCGLALIDDEALAAVRGALLARAAEGASAGTATLGVDESELRPAALLGHLIRLADSGRFRASPPRRGEDGSARMAAAESGRISQRMERDMALGLDDPRDELAAESLRLMREDERAWFETGAESGDGTDDGGAAEGSEEGGGGEGGAPPGGRGGGGAEAEAGAAPGGPLPLILFLRTDASPSLLRSRSAVERLAREAVSDESIHLLVLGRGIDAATVSLPDEGGGAGSGGVGSAVPRMGRQQNQGAGTGMGQGPQPGAPFFGMPPGMMPQADGSTNAPDGTANPFAGMSSFPPGQQGQQQPGTFGFSQENINASGVNDPEGSRRINIFLARTVDKDGNPGVMGAIAPPQAGNLFPQMLALQARENMMRMQQQQQGDGGDGDGDGPSEEQKQFLQRWSEMMQQQMQTDGSGRHPMPPPQFFNATIGSPFGNPADPNQQQQPPNGMPTPPPEVIQQAIQQAMNSVVDRLAHLQDQPMEDAEGNRLPPHLARAFSEVLKNENLRRGIAENLARAAPALVDPRCQGVMLSVYVPPGPDHPNRGMMPGQQQPPGQRGQGQGKRGRGKALSPQGVGPQKPQHSQGGGSVSGWLNKILSSASERKADGGGNGGGSVDESASAAAPGVDAEEVENSASEGEDADADDDEEEEEEASPDEAEDTEESGGEEQTQKTSSGGTPRRKEGKSSDRDRDKRISAIAVAGALGAAASGDGHRSSGSGSAPRAVPSERARRHLSRLQSLSRPHPLASPSDPVRSRSWDAWAARERGAVVFRKNRGALVAELSRRRLGIRMDAGTRGAGSVLRRMMSVRDVSGEMGDVIRAAVEAEAARSQRHGESPWEGDGEGAAAAATTVMTRGRAIDESLEQLLPGDSASDAPGGEDANTAEAKDGAGGDSVKSKRRVRVQYLHPSSLESALSLTCRITPSPSGAPPSSGASSAPDAQASHRTRDEILALAQDKHERALCSQVVSPQDIGVSYDMIGGLADVKELLRQSITYPLKFPHLYSEGIAREAVKGVLLFGPPGTGKTMLAKAVATEGGATFLSVDASSVENKWLGESEKNAKAVFTLARRLAPCVVFIDEVDSILSSREGSSDDSAHGTLTSVKTTMMSEWDGLNSGTNGGGAAGSDRVIVIGSTNRPFDLDEAVLRRFPRRILVDLPDAETRREILEVTLAENRLAPDVNLTRIAERLEGYTGSDIKEVCREAVVGISHEQARLLDQGFFMEEDGDASDGESSESSSAGGGVAGLQRLRPVAMRDFDAAMGKLKKSVSEKGRELARVWEWNEEYGEIKKRDRGDHLPQLMNMFL